MRFYRLTRLTKLKGQWCGVGIEVVEKEGYNERRKEGGGPNIWRSS
jgi:hypothetical protein